MNITLIVAIALNNVIGRADGTIPWRLKSDMRYFKSVTSGKPIIMGRKTWNTFPKALPNRTNIVITSNKDNLKSTEGCIVVGSLEEAFKVANEYIDANDPDNNEVMVIGGAQIYELGMPYCTRMLITRVYAEPEGDVIFPPIETRKWVLKSNTPGTPGEENQYVFEFLIYDRVGKPDRTFTG